ncbi:MAG: DUF1801 domain-containing protein [Saprospiraceae bacterium]|nr:DUF1801 domain-containing protein [Saprospiraceae bacterium]
MAKAKLKTTENDASVAKFLDGVKPDAKKQDAKAILAMMKKITGSRPKMWGGSIIGFGKYHYKYKSGREGEMLKIGFSPRQAALTLYVMPGFDGLPDLLSKLGKHSKGKSCLYIKKLGDIDQEVLQEIIAEAWTYMNEKYG